MRRHFHVFTYNNTYLCNIHKFSQHNIYMVVYTYILLLSFFSPITSIVSNVIVIGSSSPMLYLKLKKKQINTTK